MCGAGQGFLEQPTLLWFISREQTEQALQVRARVLVRVSDTSCDRVLV